MSGNSQQKDSKSSILGKYHANPTNEFMTSLPGQNKTSMNRNMNMNMNMMGMNQMNQRNMNNMQQMQMRQNNMNMMRMRQNNMQMGMNNGFNSGVNMTGMAQNMNMNTMSRGGGGRMNTNMNIQPMTMTMTTAPKKNINGVNTVSNSANLFSDLGAF
eukprot:UN07038